MTAGQKLSKIATDRVNWPPTQKVNTLKTTESSVVYNCLIDVKIAKMMAEKNLFSILSSPRQPQEFSFTSGRQHLTFFPNTSSLSTVLDGGWRSEFSQCQKQMIVHHFQPEVCEKESLEICKKRGSNFSEFLKRSKKSKILFWRFSWWKSVVFLASYSCAVQVLWAAFPFWYEGPLFADTLSWEWKGLRKNGPQNVWYWHFCSQARNAQYIVPRMRSSSRENVFTENFFKKSSTLVDLFKEIQLKVEKDHIHFCKKSQGTLRNVLQFVISIALKIPPAFLTHN